MSFLGVPSPDPDTSATTIGWIRGSVPSGSIEPSRFEENGDFMQLVHKVIQRAAYTSVYLSALAKARGSGGFVHISDERNAPAANRTPEPDDIIGSLLVREDKDGQLYVDPATYEPNAFYRPCTRDGIIRLNAELHQGLLAAAEEAREIEYGLAEDAQSGDPA